MSNALRVSQRCGRGPLLAGVGLFLLWLIARIAQQVFDSDWAEVLAFGFAFLGFVVLCVGPLFFAIGAIALGVHVWRGGGSPHGNHGRSWGAIWASGAVLISNFLVAGVILLLVAAMDGALGSPEDHGYEPEFPWTYNVLLHNASGNDLSQARIRGCGSMVEVGRIAAGEWKVLDLCIEEAGMIRFTAEGPGPAYSILVDELAEPTWNHRSILTLHPNGEATARPPEVW